MKNAIVQLGLVLICISSVHAVKLLQTSSFHTRVFPSGAADGVWAIQGTDSIRMQGSDGNYYITTLNPGHWRIWVDAKSPYRNAELEVMNIRPGANKDLGEIRLEK
jgi:hypothetical protein